jgi:hypothetical protein
MSDGNMRRQSEESKEINDEKQRLEQLSVQLSLKRSMSENNFRPQEEQIQDITEENLALQQLRVQQDPENLTSLSDGKVGQTREKLEERNEEEQCLQQLRAQPALESSIPENNVKPLSKELEEMREENRPLKADLSLESTSNEQNDESEEMNQEKQYLQKLSAQLAMERSMLQNNVKPPSKELDEMDDELENHTLQQLSAHQASESSRSLSERRQSEELNELNDQKQCLQQLSSQLALERSMAENSGTPPSEEFDEVNEENKSLKLLSAPLVPEQERRQQSVEHKVTNEDLEKQCLQQLSAQLAFERSMSENDEKPQIEELEEMNEEQNKGFHKLIAQQAPQSLGNVKQPSDELEGLEMNKEKQCLQQLSAELALEKCMSDNDARLSGEAHEEVNKENQPLQQLKSSAQPSSVNVRTAYASDNYVREESEESEEGDEEKTSFHQLSAQLTPARSVSKTNVHEERKEMNKENHSFLRLNSQLTQPRCAPADNVGELTEEEVRRTMEENRSLKQLNAQLIGQRSVLEDNVRQLNEELRKSNRDKQSLQLQLDAINSSMEVVRAEMTENQRRLDDAQELWRTSEAARQIAERRLEESQRVLNIPLQDVRLIEKELGSGSFGGVRVGYWRGCLVAVKSLHKELAKEQYQRRLFEQEVVIYSRLHHPNIVAICGVIRDPFSLIMELLQASLADVISTAHKSGRYLTLREQIDVSHNCLSGLTYLHNLPRPVLHGDIRPTNILMTSVMSAKLADLGAARFTDSSLSVGPMSPSYVAPERLADRTLPNSKAADVYSMGITLCELFTGYQVDPEDRPRQLGSIGQKNLCLMCTKMVYENAEKRVTAREALERNDELLRTEEYNSCAPRRMVKGIMDGVEMVTLSDRPW